MVCLERNLEFEVDVASAVYWSTSNVTIVTCMVLRFESARLCLSEASCSEVPSLARLWQGSAPFEREVQQRHASMLVDARQLD